jgi:hypothetical protein
MLFDLAPSPKIEEARVHYVRHIPVQHPFFNRTSSNLKYVRFFFYKESALCLLVRRTRLFIGFTTTPLAFLRLLWHVVNA